MDLPVSRPNDLPRANKIKTAPEAQVLPPVNVKVISVIQVNVNGLKRKFKVLHSLARDYNASVVVVWS